MIYTVPKNFMETLKLPTYFCILAYTNSSSNSYLCIIGSHEPLNHCLSGGYDYFCSSMGLVGVNNKGQIAPFYSIQDDVWDSFSPTNIDGKYYIRMSGYKVIYSNHDIVNSNENYFDYSQNSVYFKKSAEQITSITLKQGIPTLKKGMTFDLMRDLKIEPSNCCPIINLSLENSDVCKFDKGKVTALKEGVCNIICEEVF